VYIFASRDASSLLAGVGILDPPLASAMTFLLFMATTMRLGADVEDYCPTPLAFNG
jgi:hypothetical protein